MQFPPRITLVDFMHDYILAKLGEDGRGLAKLGEARGYFVRMGKIG